MNQSISVCGQFDFAERGTCGSATGSSDQCVDVAAGGTAGNTAPLAIHVSMARIKLLSSLRVGGISSDWWRMAATSKLAVGLPGNHQRLLRATRCRPGRDVTNPEKFFCFHECLGPGSWYGPSGIDQPCP